MPANPASTADAVRTRYEAAITQLTADCESDPQVIAVVLLGSLAYDQVWERSDLDVLVITQEGKVVQPPEILLYEGVFVHLMVKPRNDFVASVNRATDASFWSSILMKGRLILSKDPTLARLWDELPEMGNRDREAGMLSAAALLVMTLTKAEKWLRVKQDPHYAASYLHAAVNELARLILIRAGEIPTREVLDPAARHEPDLIQFLYRDFMDQPKTHATVQARLDRVYGYLREHRDEIFGPLLDYLADANGPVSARDLDRHFNRHTGAEYVALAAEWLAMEGVLSAVAIPRRITDRSRGDVQEAAFAIRETA